VNPSPDLATLVEDAAITYSVVGKSVQDRIAGSDVAQVDGYDTVLAQAVIAVGGAEAGAFAPLVPRAAAQVAALGEGGEAIQPHLAVLDVVNLLQVMGLQVPETTLTTCRSWLAGMPTAHVEPERWHWARGLAALALGDRATARTIAALPESGPTGIHPREDPGVNIQAWFALFVAAVEDGLAWSDLALRWDQFLVLLPVFVEIDVLAEIDLAWVGRVLHHEVAGAPLGSVADWVQQEVHRVAGVEPAGDTGGGL
jgi:hypothetical protein